MIHKALQRTQGATAGVSYSFASKDNSGSVDTGGKTNETTVEALGTQYLLDRAAVSDQGSAFQSAANDLRRVLGSVPASKIGAVTKRAESVLIRKWAEANGLIIDPAKFDSAWKDPSNFKDGKPLAGGEHDVVLSADGLTVEKRNRMEDKYHASYLEYFDRMLLFNYLFPSAAYDSGKLREFRQVTKG